MANISPYPVGIKNFPTWCRMGAVKNRHFVPKNFHSPRGAEWVPSKTGILCLKTSILHMGLYGSAIETSILHAHSLEGSTQTYKCLFWTTSAV